jgi:tetratricopeptide (TPR) repeat protein
LFQRFAAQLQLGKIEQAEADLTNQALIAEQLRQPAQLWQAYSGQAMLALSRGRLSEAESLTEQAFTVGKHALAGEFALSAYTFQLLTLRDFQERLEEVENVVREAVAAFPARPVFRCALAYLDARLGRTDDAAKALRDLTNDRSSLPFDMEWLLGMSLLAETSAILDDTDPAANIYELLLPWATLNVADAPEAIRGSVSRYLGILAALLEHWKEAMRHFEHALKMNERMGLRPWLAYTQHDYAQMLTHGGQMQQRASEINEAAISACRDLGISPRLLGQRTQIRQQHADDTPIHQ